MPPDCITPDGISACLISAARALREGSATIDAVGRMLRAETDFAPYAEAIEVVAGQIARNEALRQEMEAAARIQQSILPHAMAWRGTAAFAEIAASMRPARHVGGDFYDYFLIERGSHRGRGRRRVGQGRAGGSVHDIGQECLSHGGALRERPQPGF